MWINSTLADLTYLDICVEQMEENDIATLHELPSLVVLRLSLQNNPRGLTVRHSGFVCLTALSFTLEYPGQGFMFEAGAMPKLEKLEYILQLHDPRSDFDYGNSASLIAERYQS